jgi:hypothetical protein
MQIEKDSNTAFCGGDSAFCSSVNLLYEHLVLL